MPKYVTTAFCATCGKLLSDEEWHPTTGKVISGKVVKRSFCDSGCLSEWK